MTQIIGNNGGGGYAKICDVVADVPYECWEGESKAISGDKVYAKVSAMDETLSTALQPGDNVSVLCNDAGYIDNTVNDLCNYTLSCDLCAVATSGKYCDLTGTPTIPTDNCQLANSCGYTTCIGTLVASDLNPYAKTCDLCAVATSGSYSDLSNKPTIPSVIDSLTSSCTGEALSAKQGCVLNSCITDINNKIPSAATSSNQLADKCFVNSSINSIAAYFITKNAQGDQFATYAELAAATTFYSGGQVRVPTQNDYTIVASDENHDNATTRYIYQGNQWEYQYTVNETALTQAQLDALNSGITSTKVTCYDGYATSKQDVSNMVCTLTGADNSHYPSAKAVADALSCAGVGDMLKSVYDPNNCNSDVFNYNNLYNKPTIPTNNNQLTNGCGYTTCTGTVVAGDLTPYAKSCDLCTVATSGKYCDLSGLPTIPTNNNQLTNGCGYTTCTGTVVASDLTPYAKTCDLDTVATSGKYCDLTGTPSLCTVATSGKYCDLTGKPTIGNATLSICRNCTLVNSFGANATSNVSVNIDVPTDTCQLSNTAGFITGISCTDVTTALGYTPYSNANPCGYTSCTGTLSATNTGSNGQVLTKTSSGPTWCDASGGINNDTTCTTSTVTGIWAGTEAEYTSIGTKSGTVLYFTF